MRLQHNISPPAPGRGGSRKRKRGAEDEQTQGTSTPVESSTIFSPPINSDTSGINVLKVEPHTPVDSDVESNWSEIYANIGTKGVEAATAATAPASTSNGRQRRHTRGSQKHAAEGGEDEEGYTSSSSDILPPSLQSHFDETTGLVLGRTPAKAMYLLMKAKQRFALEQNQELLEQLRVAKLEMKREKEEKETTLDSLLRRMLGCVSR